MAYATTTELEQFVQQDLDDGRANLLLDLASGALDSAALRMSASIAEVPNDVEELDGNGARTINLARWPVTAVTAVNIDGEPLDAADYRWSRAGVLRRAGGRVWPAGERNIEATYTHGLPDAQVPPSVKTATLIVAARLLTSPTGAPESLGDFSHRMNEHVPDVVADMVRRALR